MVRAMKGKSSEFRGLILLVGVAFHIVMTVLSLLFVYWIFVTIFRYAFGIELANLFH
jgi:hypothetical protein